MTGLEPNMTRFFFQKIKMIQPKPSEPELDPLNYHLSTQLIFVHNISHSLHLLF
jgi:hypothetical protein